MYTERLYTPKMSAQNGQPVGAEAIRSGGCFSTDPNEQVQFARHYIDMGFDQLYFDYSGPDQKAFLANFGHDVLTKLRG